MRVFVAGATGALGRPLVKLLLEGRHHVTGMTRSRPEVIEELGAVPVIANAFDAGGLKEAVEGAKPDAVIHVLTAIPKVAIPSPRRLKENDRLRIEGTRNLIAAAQSAGASRFLAESITFAFRGRAEQNMKPLGGMGAFQASVDAAVSLEEQTKSFGGIVLRYAYFYGPGTSFQNEIPTAIRRRLFPIVGPGTGWWSFIHIADAATATVAALERGKDGEVYNICDDEPILAVDALDFIADSIGAKHPFHLPPVAPSYARHYFNRATGASNEKIKGELSWAPRYRTFKEGFAADPPR